MLELRDIEEKYQAENGEITALDKISFSVEKGEFISLVGPSGCGKSTLLSVIAGILRPTAGQVLLEGEEITGISPKIGYMLQKDNLLEWRTIWGNVILGLEIRRQMTEENLKRVHRLLETYGLEEFKEKYPSPLSGGMRQRAALIRTLAVGPDILLLDEAFSALDYQTRLAVTDDVYRILKKEGKTTIMVTHDISESISMSDRVIVLTGRPARIRDSVPVSFGQPDRTPLSCRNSPLFAQYFDRIWKELDVHGI